METSAAMNKTVFFSRSLGLKLTTGLLNQLDIFISTEIHFVFIFWLFLIAFYIPTDSTNLCQEFNSNEEFF